jgi:hypothetical protein
MTLPRATASASLTPVQELYQLRSIAAAPMPEMVPSLSLVKSFPTLLSTAWKYGGKMAHCAEPCVNCGSKVPTIVHNIMHGQISDAIKSAGSDCTDCVTCIVSALG